MNYLYLFILGVVFVKWIVPFLDIFLEWFSNIISRKIYLIQSDMVITNKKVEDYCSDGKDNEMTHAIGFRIDEDVETERDFDEDDDD